MREPSEREIIARLEQDIDWAGQGIVERDGEALLSLDETLDRLNDAYESHMRETGPTADASKVEVIAGIGRVAELLQRDFSSYPELIPGITMQTRGEGLCVVMDDGRPYSEHAGVGSDVRLRGEFAGVHVVSVLTDYALITQEYGVKSSYVPRLCVILRGSNIGSLGSFDNLELSEGVVAIPLLGDDGLRLDRIV